MKSDVAGRNAMDEITIENTAFDLPWLKLGVQMVFRWGRPSIGDFMLLEHGGKMQPLWFLGIS